MNIRKIALKAIVFLLTVMVIPLSTYAAAPYMSFTMDKYSKWVPVQAPFIPEKVLQDVVIRDDEDPSKEIITKFSNPNDIFVGSDDTLYIADTDNDRIVHMKSSGEVIKIIEGDESDKKTLLKSPLGVFVNSDGMIYVADNGNKRIAVYNRDGSFSREITDPKNPLLPPDYKFDPEKVIVDQRGYIYLVTKQGYYGLTQLKPNGEFNTFFGSNKVVLNAFEKFRRLFYTREQLSRSAVKLPGTITNIFISPNGLIYTCTANLSRGEIKKINIAGEDMLKNKEFKAFTKGIQKSSFTDVAVDGSGNIAALDSVLGRVCIYDENGVPIFAFGDIGNEKSILGVFGYPTAISYDSKGNLYVVDSKFNYIHVFKPTEFGKLVFKALELYNSGAYLESLEPWKEVLKLNSNFYMAYLGIGKAQYKSKNWKDALESFKTAKDSANYSNAYLKLRVEWTKKYFGISASLFIVFMAAILLVRRVRHLRRRSL